MIKTQTSLGLNDDARQHLQTLLQVNLDCRDGFAKAVEFAPSTELKGIAEATANRHAKQKTALEEILWSNFDDQTIAGSVTASVQRVWLGLRTKMQECDVAVFDEMAKMHGYVRDHYMTALKNIRGRAIRQMLKEHVQSAELGIQQLKTLRGKLNSN